MLKLAIYVKFTPFNGRQLWMQVRNLGLPLFHLFKIQHPQIAKPICQPDGN